MSWVFNGSAGFDQVLRLLPGGCAAIDGGPLTWVAITKTNAGPEKSAIGGGFNAGAERWGTLFEADGHWYVNGDFSGFNAAAAVGFWQLIGYTKASGSAAVRWHLYDYNAAGWTHTNGSTIADAGVPDEIRIGRFFNRADGKIAAVGAFPTALGDATFEAGMHTALQAWVDAGAVGLWTMTGPVAAGLTDLTGGGADQFATIGTDPTLDADEPPGFSYTLGAAAAERWGRLSL
jgi:hypothetical protein